ncbi:tripartite tricarboxylate transporter substrate binding protein [Ensifer sp. YR511]|uniref:tripartite tricarboxylate transporter substrate binding protein n=1 Tax=Ensifer sp. YR511 TaxID=1855294 RepID=UPI00088C5C49|nr:tripartite tricarboxylate transporter substrate binding protein [Ensifer sp. YR511]SDN73441.1 Tripartite-type tricarboxylate transporter, receptor component TctC [Ensifer sp. YR511]
MKRKLAAAVAATVLCAATYGPTNAASPEPLLEHCRTIRMIVPYTAGGGGDVGARLLAPEMSAILAIPVQVENVPGAGSQIGITQLSHAKPDGCTIGWTHLPAAITIYLDKSRQAAFDRKSLVPIAMYVIDGGGIAVKADSPYTTLKDLIEATKASPGTISVSDSGVLSEGHLLLEKLTDISGAQFNIVHGAGGAEGMADLLGGHVHAMTMNLGGANVELAKSGQIRLLAVFTDKELETYQGVKTAFEQGYPMTSATSRALSAPAGTPVEIIQALSAAVKKAMDAQALRDKAAKLGLSLHYLDSDETAKYWDEMENQIKPAVEAQVSK